MMTANKHFKRRVRERARRTGESYTAALRNLRRIDAKEQVMQWQRVEKPDFGYAIHVPAGWEERPPDLRNSPWETARFVEPTDRRHLVIVFRPLLRPGWTPAEAAAQVRDSLAASGFADFQISDDSVAGRPAALMECRRVDAGRVWALRQYFVVQDGYGLFVGCGSAAPDEDEELFTTVAGLFEVLEPA
jgi:hypothetical protein